MNDSTYLALVYGAANIYRHKVQPLVESIISQPSTKSIHLYAVSASDERYFDQLSRTILRMLDSKRIFGKKIDKEDAPRILCKQLTSNIFECSKLLVAIIQALIKEIPEDVQDEDDVQTIMNVVKMRKIIAINRDSCLIQHKLEILSILTKLGEISNLIEDIEIQCPELISDLKKQLDLSWDPTYLKVS